jgi:hypothetical protein
MAPHGIKPSGDGPVVPPCRNCRDNARVHPLLLTWVAEEDVQYWSCEGCGFVWATQDGEVLRSASSRKSA